MRGKSVAWLECRGGKHRDGAKGRGKNKPEQKEVMAALQEGGGGQGAVSRSVGGGARREGHQSSARAREPEISSSRLICRALPVSGQDRKLARGEGLDMLALPSDGGRFRGESSVEEKCKHHGDSTQMMFSSPKASPVLIWELAEPYSALGCSVLGDSCGFFFLGYLCLLKLKNRASTQLGENTLV